MIWCSTCGILYFTHRLKLCNSIYWKVTKHLLNSIAPPSNHTIRTFKNHLVDWLAMPHPVYHLFCIPFYSIRFLSTSMKWYIDSFNRINPINKAKCDKWIPTLNIKRNEINIFFQTDKLIKLFQTLCQTEDIEMRHIRLTFSGKEYRHDQPEVKEKTIEEVGLKDRSYVFLVSRLPGGINVFWTFKKF